MAHNRTNVLRIVGGRRLLGAVDVAGAKNAALPIMAATILADQPVTLYGVPRLTDVDRLAALLGELGVRCCRSAALAPDTCVPARVAMSGAGMSDPASATATSVLAPVSGLDAKIAAADCMQLACFDPSPKRARYGLVSRMRASFCVLGPLLARRQRASVALPGGCNLGDRPVDLHLRGLTALGADVEIRRGYVIAKARRLRGASIDMSGPRGPTVTGTANLLSAAVLARGTTVLVGAASEPEIVDLGRFLNHLGARIEGLGTTEIRIRGVRELGGGSWQIIPDRIEAGTLLLAGAITGGRVTVRGAEPDHMRAVLELLAEGGSTLDVEKDEITLDAPKRPRPFSVEARPYPGVPTDLQAQFMSLASVAGGTSHISDRVFPERFQHVAELVRLGARIRLAPNSGTVAGVPSLFGAAVRACDLRASAALVLAALAARGRSTIYQIHHLDRGYERLERKLARLGAEIDRCRP